MTGRRNRRKLANVQIHSDLMGGNVQLHLNESHEWEETDEEENDIVFKKYWKIHVFLSTCTTNSKKVCVFVFANILYMMKIQFECVFPNSSTNMYIYVFSKM